MAMPILNYQRIPRIPKVSRLCLMAWSEKDREPLMNADRAAPHLRGGSNPGALAHTGEITHSWDAKTTVGA